MLKKWTDEEIEFLKKHYPYEDTDYIAETLNRPINGITNKATKLGIKKYKETLPEGYKRCSKCKKILPINEFYINKNRNKPYSNCKSCDRKRNKMYLEKKLNKNKTKINNNSTITIKEKKCAKCGKILSIDNFGKRRNNNGFQSYCKQCEREYWKKNNEKRLMERGW